MYKKIIVFGVIMMFVGVGFISIIRGDIEYSNEITKQDFLSLGWKYSSTIELEASTPTEEYQVKIELTQSNFDYDNANNDGSDIRFCDIYGNKLNYWVEEWNPERISIVWVKVLHTWTSKIYIYYGNKDAKGESNGDETFVFFDDFKGDNIDETKWERIFNPNVDVSKSELKLTDTNGDKGYLYSKVKIPLGTSIRFRYKQEQVSPNPNPPNGQQIRLTDGKPPIVNEANFIVAGDSKLWNEWYFETERNGTSNHPIPISGQPTYNSYYVNEYRWYNNKVEYYYNNELKANSSIVPYGELNIAIKVCQFNKIICDWIVVTKISETSDDILFSDNFNDNSNDSEKWHETFDDGAWEETNQRTELKLYEPGSGSSREEIESLGFNVSFSSNKSVLISCDILTNIENKSTAGGGFIGFIVTDGTNWIKIEYRRQLYFLVYEDSNDGHSTTINPPGKPQYDGCWNNEIQIFGNRYHMKLDNYTTVWIYDNLFPETATLKVKMYIYSSGVTIDDFMFAGFDNVKVEVPVSGMQPPYLPSIYGGEYLKPFISNSFTFSAIDPDFDSVYFFIDWGDNGPGNLTGPHYSGVYIMLTHNWNKLGDYTIRIKAMDIKGCESLCREHKIKVKFIKNLDINLFNYFVEKLFVSFPFFEKILNQYYYY